MAFFYKRKAPKIVDVFCPMPPILVPYIEENRSQIERELEQKGRELQTKDLKKEKRLWVLWEDWFSIYKLEIAPGVYSYLVMKARAGWTFDLASIPGAAEIVEKRDDRDGLIPAGGHDIHFGIQFPFFEIANDFFYQSMRFYGMRRFRAWRRWRAVQSRFGWEAWEESSDPKELEDELRFASCVEVPTLDGLNLPGMDVEDEIEMRRRL